MSKTSAHFRSLLEDETAKLNGLCAEWEAIMEQAGETIINEDVSGEIRSAIGLAHLLVNQRFKQFSGLIKNCEEGLSPPVTPQDLEGFWEMIYFQVEDIYKKFKELNAIKTELSLT